MRHQGIMWFHLPLWPGCYLTHQPWHWACTRAIPITGKWLQETELEQAQKVHIALAGALDSFILTSDVASPHLQLMVKELRPVNWRTDSSLQHTSPSCKRSCKRFQHSNPNEEDPWWSYWMEIYSGQALSVYFVWIERWPGIKVCTHSQAISDSFAG
jgi:hypothetical protein